MKSHLELLGGSHFHHLTVLLSSDRTGWLVNEKNGENLLKHSYPTTSIFNDPIHYSVSGMLMDGRGLEANQRNLLHLEALEVLIYGPGLYRSAQLLLLIELHCPRPLPPLPFLAQDESGSL